MKRHPPRQQPRRSILSPLLAAALLGACQLLGACESVGPDFERPDPQLPKRPYFDRAAPAGQSPREPRDNVDPSWWRRFRDPTLSSLITRAVEANLDVQTATLKLIESRAQRDSIASAQLPAINASGSYQRELLSQNGIVSLAKQTSGTAIVVPAISIYQPAFDASWELDIWGHVRRQVEAAEAQATALDYQRRDTLVSVEAEIARDYFELRGTQRRIGIARDNLARTKDILDLTKTRAAGGLTTGLDVENAAAQAESIRAQIPALEAQASALKNTLAFLVDAPPGALDSELSSPPRATPTPRPAPLGLPSELARRRPDIRRAEAELHAATANIGVAVAEFYPTVKLNGTVAVNALDLKNLWKGSSLQYQFGPSVTLPIFDGGRLKSQLDLRETQQQEAAIAYHKTVLQAWREVVDALVACRKDQERLSRLKAQVAHSREAASLARIRYDRGVADFLRVLDAQRVLLDAELQQEDSATNVATDFVKLYKALGGGWEETFPETASASQ